MTQIKRATIVQNAFKDYYNVDYKLLIIHEGEHCSTFAIVDISEIIIEFSVSNTSIFDAKSHSGLLSCKSELRTWYNFLKQVEAELEREL